MADIPIPLGPPGVIGKLVDQGDGTFAPLVATSGGGGGGGGGDASAVNQVLQLNALGAPANSPAYSGDGSLTALIRAVRDYFFGPVSVTSGGGNLGSGGVVTAANTDYIGATLTAGQRREWVIISNPSENSASFWIGEGSVTVSSGIAGNATAAVELQPGQTMVFTHPTVNYNVSCSVPGQKIKITQAFRTVA